MPPGSTLLVQASSGDLQLPTYVIWDLQKRPYLVQPGWLPRLDVLASLPNCPFENPPCDHLPVSRELVRGLSPWPSTALQLSASPPGVTRLSAKATHSDGIERCFFEASALRAWEDTVFITTYFTLTDAHGLIAQPSPDGQTTAECWELGAHVSRVGNTYVCDTCPSDCFHQAFGQQVLESSTSQLPSRRTSDWRLSSNFPQENVFSLRLDLSVQLHRERHDLLGSRAEYRACVFPSPELSSTGSLYYVRPNKHLNISKSNIILDSH